MESRPSCSRSFSALLETDFKEVAEAIKARAHKIHEDVNQHYDGYLPYSFHLDSVAQIVVDHLDSMLARRDDLLPVYFGAYFHDSIEDARLTYKDVLKVASQWMTEQQALLAAEIVYALTNEKGRTRAERANDRYYEGIRAIPYAPMIKLADRIANMKYSATHTGTANNTMRDTYHRELSHFIEALTVADGADARFALPPDMISMALSL